MNQTGNGLAPGQYFGYNGRLLRVDMTSGKISDHELDEKTARARFVSTISFLRVVN